MCFQPCIFISRSACRGPSDEHFKPHLSSILILFILPSCQFSCVLLLSPLLTLFLLVHFFPIFFTSLALHRMTFLKLWCFLCHLTFMLWQCSSYRCIFLETLLLTQISLRNIQLFNFAVWATAGVKAQSDPCHRCKCVRGQWAGLIIQTNFCPVQDHPVSTQMTTSNLSTLPYFVQLFHFPFFLSCVLVSWWKCNERRASEGMKNSLIVFSGGGKESRGRNKNLMSWGSVRQSTLRGKLGKCVVTEAPPV